MAFLQYQTTTKNLNYMKQKVFIVFATVMLVLCSCGNKQTGGSQVPLSASADTTKSAAEDVAAVAEEDDGYDLEALAKAIEGCESLDNFYDGRAQICKDGRMGFIDKRGRLVVPIEYQPNAMGFSEGIGMLCKGDDDIYVDHDGHELFRRSDVSGSMFYEGLAQVRHDGKCGYMDRTGKTVIPIEWEFAGYFHCGRAVVYREGLYGFIDKQGKLAIPCRFETPAERQPEDFSEGLAMVINNSDREDYCYIDTMGRVAIPGPFSSAGNFHEGLASVSTPDFVGYIDKTGKRVITIEEGWGAEFHEGLALVRYNNGKKAFIDKTGKKVFDVPYESANDFHDGMALVWEGEKRFGYIDKTGRLAVPCIYYAYKPFSEGLAAVQKDGKWGFVDKEGKSTFDY